jgi:kynurenine formamidase
MRNQADVPILETDNEVGYGFISDLVMGTTHVGTHIDALAHVTAGPQREWHGGHSADMELGDFGPLSSDASELGPLITRGVMLDVPANQGQDALDAHTAIGGSALASAAEREGISIGQGDVILVRTGAMSSWPDRESLVRCEGAGVSLDGAEWLHSHGPAAVGGDTESFEVFPSGVKGEPEPVHRFLIQQHGVPIIEWIYLEQLARDSVYEFLFVCIPLPIRGATASLIRPLAIV